MTTPSTQGNLTDAGALDGIQASATADAGERQSGSTENGWLNLAIFSIGAVAVVGFLVIMFGIYAMEPDNIIMVFTGMVILLVAAIVWAGVALFMAGRLVRRTVTSRGKKRRGPPLRQG